jgi:xanthine dehydrogenase small subunit
VTTTDFFIPRSVDEAVDLLHEHGEELVVMGGGTIMMYLVNEGQLFPRKVMSLKRSGMDEVRTVDGHVEIGAGMTMARIAQLDALPILAQAARILGGPAVRNMATIGGNLFAHTPYGDMGVPLLALGAQVESRNKQGQHTVPLEQFYAEHPGDEYIATELVTALHVPRPLGRCAYLKLGRRHANTPSVVAVAAQVTLDNNGVCSAARIALGAAAPRPVRAVNAEAALVGQRLDAASIAAAAEAAMNETDPATDALASAWYRRRMVGLYVRKALEQVAQAG